MLSYIISSKLFTRCRTTHEESLLDSNISTTLNATDTYKKQVRRGYAADRFQGLLLSCCGTALLQRSNPQSMIISKIRNNRKLHTKGNKEMACIKKHLGRITDLAVYQKLTKRLHFEKKSASTSQVIHYL